MRVGQQHLRVTMAVGRKQLGEILVEQKLISHDQLIRALEQQQRTHQPLGAILVRMGAVDEGRLLTCLATQYAVGAWDLRRDAPSADALECLRGEDCETYHVLPLQKRGDLLLLGMRNPADTSAIEFVRNVTKLRVEPVLVDESRLLTHIRLLRQRTHRRGASVDSLVQQALAEFDHERTDERMERTDLDEGDQRPVVGLVNQLIGDAIRMSASDIHIEPRSDRIDVRYRIDGRLVKLREIPDELLPMLTTRLKIMAGLDIVEQRQPQDGRMSVELDGHGVDVRVSVVPGVYGARIVMRVLDHAVGLRELTNLGFNDHNLNLFRMLIERPYGLFLVTGPTGSGKTTTLYGALRELTDGTSNIMTVEDPVEYEIEGVSQSQVNDGIGLTFAKQLRALLRQDPDTVLVGEIRDLETAETAVRAAMTGHLVFSTLHCNDAASAVPRLLDLGVDPFLLSSSLIGVTAQRLLRTLCNDCKEPGAPTPEEELLLRAYFGVNGVSEVWRPGKCDKCFGTGYLGRTAVHEVLPVTGEVASLIAERATPAVIRRAAELYGFRSMQADAMERVLAGQTTLEEAKRLIAFDTLLNPAALLNEAA